MHNRNHHRSCSSVKYQVYCDFYAKGESKYFVCFANNKNKPFLIRLYPLFLARCMTYCYWLVLPKCQGVVLGNENGVGGRNWDGFWKKRVDIEDSCESLPRIGMRLKWNRNGSEMEMSASWKSWLAHRVDSSDGAATRSSVGKGEERRKGGK